MKHIGILNISTLKGFIVSRQNIERHATLKENKRPMGLNNHLSIRDSTLTSCKKGSYLHINSPSIE